MMSECLNAKLIASGGKLGAGNTTNSRHTFLPAVQSKCQERNITAGKDESREAEELPEKGKQLAKIFAGRVLEGRPNSREKSFAGT
jgi:hypothetical protein